MISFLRSSSILLALVASVLGQANVTGNCVSGTIHFDPSIMYSANNGSDKLDLARHWLSIDYGGTNVVHRPGGGIDMKLVRQPSGAASGVRISTTRYILYGKITARMRGITEPGAISTFITMSDRLDEIDVEIVGANKTKVETNVYYKGIAEWGKHGGVHQVDGQVSDTQEYTIDWRSDAIIWSINGRPIRMHRKDGPESQSPMTPQGEKWFPQTPSKVQLSVWDAGEGAKGTAEWAGGKIPWGDRKELAASFEWIDIQCYDDQNRPVDKWPLNNNDPIPTGGNRTRVTPVTATASVDWAALTASAIGSSATAAPTTAVLTATMSMSAMVPQITMPSAPLMSLGVGPDVPVGASDAAQPQFAVPTDAADPAQGALIGSATLSAPITASVPVPTDIPNDNPNRSLVGADTVPKSASVSSFSITDSAAMTASVSGLIPSSSVTSTASLSVSFFSPASTTVSPLPSQTTSPSHANVGVSYSLTFMLCTLIVQLLTSMF